MISNSILISIILLQVLVVLGSDNMDNISYLSGTLHHFNDRTVIIWTTGIAGVVASSLLFRHYGLPLLARGHEWCCRKQQLTDYQTNHLKGVPKGSVLEYSKIPERAGLWNACMKSFFENPIYLHQYIAYGHMKKGPIFREKLDGIHEVVFIADSAVVRGLAKGTSRYPRHYVPEAWKLYLIDTDRKRGVFFMEGADWYVHRGILNKTLLKSSFMKLHFEDLEAITKDLMKALWESHRHNLLKDDLVRLLYKWSLESICLVALGKKIGSFKCEKQRNFSFDKFVEGIQDIFIYSAVLESYGPQKAKDENTQDWSHFVVACSLALDIGTRYVTEALEDFDSGEISDTCLLYQLLNVHQVDREMATRLIVDLLLAGADTTVNTTNWLFYVLGKNKHFAAEARREVSSLKRRTAGVLKLTKDDLKDLPLCKNILRETIRLYPVAPFLTRQLDEQCIAGGYILPANTMTIISVYSIGRDQQYYNNASAFDPKRWEETTGCCPAREVEANSPEASVDSDSASSLELSRGSLSEKALASMRANLPWGFGTRNCVGRTAAEDQLTILIAHLVDNYSLTVQNEHIHLKMCMISVPNEPLAINLENLL